MQSSIWSTLITAGVILFIFFYLFSSGGGLINGLFGAIGGLLKSIKFGKIGKGIGNAFEKIKIKKIKTKNWFK